MKQKITAKKHKRNIPKKRKTTKKKPINSQRKKIKAINGEMSVLRNL